MAINPATFMAGASLAYSLNGADFIQIDDLLTVEAPPAKLGRVPTTRLSAPAAQMRKQPGWMDPGEVKFRVGLSKPQHLDLDFLFHARVSVEWNIRWSDDYTGGGNNQHFFIAWIGDFQNGSGVERDKNEEIISDLTLVLEAFFLLPLTLPNITNVRRSTFFPIPTVAYTPPTVLSPSILDDAELIPAPQEVPNVPVDMNLF